MQPTFLQRIALPIAFAVVTVVALIGFLWWELKQATNTVLVPNHVIQQPSVPILPLQNAQRSNQVIGPITSLRQGDIYALEGNWTAAQAAYTQAVAEDGSLPVLRKLAQAQLQSRNYESAKKTIEKLAAQGASEPDIMLLNSIVLLRTGEIVAARQLLSTATDSPQAHYGLALLAIAEGNHTQAQAELVAVQAGYEPILRSKAQTIQAAYNEYALFPDSSDIHLITLLARSLSQVQECELALPLLVQVTSTKPDYRDAWIVQGYCELFTERTENAITSFQTAYNLDPQKTATQYFLGRAYYAREDFTNAITFFEYALGNGFTPASELYALIANAAEQTNNYTLAFAQYSKLLQSEKSAYNYKKYMQIGLRINEANTVYQIGLEATPAYPADIDILELFGLAALQIGNNNEAKRAFEQVIAAEPNRTVSKQQLESM